MEILPRPGETLNARITYGGLGGKGESGNPPPPALRWMCASLPLSETTLPRASSATPLRAERIATDTPIDLPGETNDPTFKAILMKPMPMTQA